MGDIISRFGSIDGMQSTLTSTFLTVILDGLMTVFTLVLMFFYGATLAWGDRGGTVCAKMAGIHDEIMAMPMSYQTLVGDRGSVLSGGQKQHILLLLEHSTASLRFCFWMKPLVIWISKKKHKSIR